MSQAALDRLLALLVASLVASGLLTLRAGTPPTGWLFVLHGILGGALLATIVLKLRRSVPAASRAHRWSRLSLALVLAAVALAALLGGFSWAVAGGIASIGSFTVLTLHVLVGLATVPLLAVHLWPRRWRLLRPGRVDRVRVGRLISRRGLLAGVALAVAGAGMWGGAQVLDRLRGGERRFTGSRWLPAGGIPPATTFLGDTEPAIDPAGWRLRLTAPGIDAGWSLADLDALEISELTAVLDCTGGWAIETAWSGVRLDRLLAAAGVRQDASRVEVRSATGWGALLGIEEARGCLLATRVAGETLPAANGYPLRLVAPQRRGLDWVKWVTEVRVS